MTPKEKAKDLVRKFQKKIFFHVTDERLDREESKDCALIAVDEVLENSHTNVFTKYWEDVKKEIELL